MITYNKGAEITMIAYNGTSSRTAKCESVITGVVVKLTSKYIWIKNYTDDTIWKAKR